MTWDMARVARTRFPGRLTQYQKSAFTKPFPTVEAHGSWHIMTYVFVVLILIWVGLSTLYPLLHVLSNLCGTQLANFRTAYFVQLVANANFLYFIFQMTHQKRGQDWWGERCLQNVERISACVRMHHPQYSNEAIERHLDACAENNSIQKVSSRICVN